MSNKQNDHYEETKKEAEEEKPYCTCGKDANMGNDDKSYHCFSCCKPNYANWWASEMNKEPSHINPNCQDSSRCEPHGETGEVKYNPDNDFQKIPKEEFISDYAHGFQEGMIAERNNFKLKLDKAITDSVVKGGMVNGDCYLSLDLLNKYLKD